MKAAEKSFKPSSQLPAMAPPTSKIWILSHRKTASASWFVLAPKAGSRSCLRWDDDGRDQGGDSGGGDVGGRASLKTAAETAATEVAPIQRLFQRGRLGNSARSLSSSYLLFSAQFRYLI